jgi:hypothetical protein
MRWSAALTTSRLSAFAGALACATAMLATRTVAADRKRSLHKPPAAIVTPVALAEPVRDERGELVQHRWPSVPFGRHLSMSEQITDRLTEIGNRFGEHLDLLSRDMFQLKVDGRRRRAHIRIGGAGGGSDDDLFTFQIDGEIQFHNLDARVDAHINLGFDGHLLRLELPGFQLQADEVHGEYGVQLEVPVFEKRF